MKKFDRADLFDLVQAAAMVGGPRWDELLGDNSLEEDTRPIDGASRHGLYLAAPHQEDSGLLPAEYDALYRHYVLRPDGGPWTTCPLPLLEFPFTAAEFMRFNSLLVDDLRDLLTTIRTVEGEDGDRFLDEQINRMIVARLPIGAGELARALLSGDTAPAEYRGQEANEPAGTPPATAVLALLEDEVAADVPHRSDLMSLQRLAELLPLAVRHRGELTPSRAGAVVVRALLGEGKYAGSAPSRLPLYVAESWGVRELDDEEREPLRGDMQRYYVDRALNREGEPAPRPPRNQPSARTKALLYLSGRGCELKEVPRGYGGEYPGDGLAVVREDALRAFGISTEQTASLGSEPAQAASTPETSGGTSGSPAPEPAIPLSSVRGDPSAAQVHQEPAKPVQRWPHQEAAILEEIRRLGLDPLALPAVPNGKASSEKAAVRAALRSWSDAVFTKAWKRLTAAGGIGYR